MSSNYVTHVDSVIFQNNNNHIQTQPQVHQSSSSPQFNYETYIADYETYTSPAQLHIHNSSSSNHNNMNSMNHRRRNRRSTLTSNQGVYDVDFSDPSLGTFFPSMFNGRQHQVKSPQHQHHHQQQQSNYYTLPVIQRNQSFNFQSAQNGVDNGFNSVDQNLYSLNSSPTFVNSNHQFTMNSNTVIRDSPVNGYSDLMSQLQRQHEHQQQQYLLKKYFTGTETIGRHHGIKSSQHQTRIKATPNPKVVSQPGPYIPWAYNIRFAVNGISKFSKGGSTLPLNKNIQAGDFGDDAGMIAENSRCVVIGIVFFFWIVNVLNHYHW